MPSLRPYSVQKMVEAILTLVAESRPIDGNDISELVSWGPGPRAGQSLMKAVRARALLDGRLAPSIYDVKALAKPILQHRIALNFASRSEGVTMDEVIEIVTKKIGS